MRTNHCPLWHTIAVDSPYYRDHIIILWITRIGVISGYRCCTGLGKLHQHKVIFIIAVIVRVLDEIFNTYDSAISKAESSNLNTGTPWIAINLGMRNPGVGEEDMEEVRMIGLTIHSMKFKPC